MRRLPRTLIVIALMLSGACGGQASSDTASSSYGRWFTLVGDFSLGEAADRTDYESIDPVARRLYISKMGAGTLLVFDIDRNMLIAQLDGFPKVTGVLAVPELHKIYASVPGAGLGPSLSVGLGMIGLSSGSGTVAIIDTGTFKRVATLPGGVFPDGIAYDSNDRRIFVSDELGSAVLVINADENKIVGRIAAGGEVGNVRYDPVSGRIYAPVQSHDELLAIDPKRLAIVARYPLAGGEHPHGLSIAPDAAIGYVACDGNDRLLTVDLATGRILARQVLAHDPDVLAVDPAAKRLYVASESGNLSSFDINAVGAPIPLDEVFIGEGGHAVAVDPVSHRLYFALADVSGRAVLRVLAPRH